MKVATLWFEPARDVGGLGGQDRAAALVNLQRADAAAALPAAGGGHEDLVVGQRAQQGAAAPAGDGLVGVAVDRDRDLAAGHQARLGEHQHQHECQDHDRKADHAEEDGGHQS
jgi:hypothetical protein